MLKNFKENDSNTGIYKISNLINGKFYIGSTNRTFKKRYQEHLNDLKANRHVNKHLQSSFNKYGESVFLFEVIEVVESDRDIILEIEQKYLILSFDNQKLCFNSRKDVIDTSIGPWSKTPEKTKEKMKKSGKAAWKKDDGNRRKKVSQSTKKLWENEDYRKKQIEKRLGRKNSKEQIEKMSQAALNRKPDSEETKMAKKLAARKRFEDPKQRELLKIISNNRPTISEETRNKISKANKGRPCSKETKEKIKQNHLIKKVGPSKKALLNSSIKNAKIYNIYLIDPNNKVYFLQKNAKQFAKKHNLSADGVVSLIKGRRKSHRGWKILDR